MSPKRAIIAVMHGMVDLDEVLRWAVNGISNHALRVYVFLLGIHNDGFRDDPKYPQCGFDFKSNIVRDQPLENIGDNLLLSPDSVQQALKELERMGLLSVYWCEYPEIEQYNVYKFPFPTDEQCARSVKQLEEYKHHRSEENRKQREAKKARKLAKAVEQAQ